MVFHIEDWRRNQRCFKMMLGKLMKGIVDQNSKI